MSTKPGQFQIASTPTAFRLAARVLLARGVGRELITFGVADTHAHAVLACSRAEAGVFARAVETTLRLLLHLPVPFEAARIRPIVDQRHLGHAARYSLRQEERHGTRLDALRDGTSLPDLLGLRVVEPGFAARFAARLPRQRPEDLLPLLGVELGQGPVDFTALGHPLGHVLADAAAAALALPDLDGQDAERMAARRAAIHLALAAGLRPGRVADLLRSSVRAVQRLAASPPRLDLVRAIGLQLRLRAALAEG